MTLKEIEINGVKYTCNLGTGNCFALHKNIELRNHPKFDGKGLFATDVIKKGEVIWVDSNPFQYTTQHLTREQVEKLDEETKKIFKNFCYQIKDDMFWGPLSQEQADFDASNYMNHSCEPTCWFISDEVMVATRDIQPGEEITYDYATSECSGFKQFDCCCGAKSCRGIFRGDEWKKKEIQEKYKGHFVPYLQKKIDENKFH